MGIVSTTVPRMLRAMPDRPQVLHHLNYATLDGIEQGYDQDVNIFKFLGS